MLYLYKVRRNYLTDLPGQRGDVPFQLGDVPGDEDIFGSPKGAQPYSSASAIPSTFGSTMQGVIPSMQPITMLRNRATDFGTRSQVGGVDAQAFYPATACVFVAKYVLQMLYRFSESSN